MQMTKNYNDTALQCMLSVVLGNSYKQSLVNLQIRTFIEVLLENLKDRRSFLRSSGIPHIINVPLYKWIK